MHSVHRPFVAGLAALATVFLGVAPALAGADLSSSLRVIAASGQPAPGAPAGTRFAFFFPSEFDGAPGIGADSTIAFAALLSDDTAGFWLDHGAGPELLAISGAPAPGTPAGVVFSQRQSEVVIASPPLLARGRLALQNTLIGPGIGLTNDEGIWNSAAAGLALTVREGAPAPGLAGVQLGGLMLRSLDDAGGTVFSTTLRGGVISFNDESIWRASPGDDPTLLAREGFAAPGAGFGVVFAAIDGSATFPIITGNAAGDVLFQGNLDGPGTSAANDEALFIRHGDDTRLFVREGDPVPGMPGFIFSQGATSGFAAANIALNNTGHVAMIASVSGAPGAAAALLSDAGGAPTTIVRSGDPAPGAGGNFGILGSVFMNTRGDVAFLASTTEGSPRPPLGVWLQSSAGLRAIALPGEQLSGLPAGTVLQDVQALNGLNDDGLLLFTCTIGLPTGFSSTALLAADPAGHKTVIVQTGATVTIGATPRTVQQIFTRNHALSEAGRAAFAVHLTDFSNAEFEARITTCPADANRDGVLTTQDIFDFLALWFAADPRADFDGTGGITTQDIFTFLAAWFAGCP